MNRIEKEFQANGLLTFDGRRRRTRFIAAGETYLEVVFRQTPRRVVQQTTPRAGRDQLTALREEPAGERALQRRLPEKVLDVLVTALDGLKGPLGFTTSVFRVAARGAFELHVETF
jgi:hypothetical protein